MDRLPRRLLDKRNLVICNLVKSFYYFNPGSGKSEPSAEGRPEKPDDKGGAKIEKKKEEAGKNRKGNYVCLHDRANIYSAGLLAYYI